MIERVVRLGLAGLVFALWASPGIAQDSGTSDLDGLMPLTGEEVAVLRQARGIIEAEWEAVLASEIAGRIVSLPFGEGDRFGKGDELVGFDCAFYRAALNEAEATLTAARQTLDVNQQLAALNAVSVLEVALSDAEVVRATAAVRSRQLVVQRCSLLAPADGWVVGRHAALYETVAEGQGLLAVVGAGELRIRLIVPSSWLLWLQPGMAFTFRVDETGQDHAAELTKTGARVDPASQTMVVFGRLTDEARDLISGMSGTAHFPDGSATN